VISTSGTLDSNGLNKVGGDSNCRELGYTTMTDTIGTSPGTTIPKASNPRVIGSPLVNAVQASNDTEVMDFPAGTIESQGINAG